MLILLLASHPAPASPSFLEGMARLGRGTEAGRARRRPDRDGGPSGGGARAGWRNPVWLKTTMPRYTLLGSRCSLTAPRSRRSTMRRSRRGRRALVPAVAVLALCQGALGDQPYNFIETRLDGRVL